MGLQGIGVRGIIGRYYQALSDEQNAAPPWVPATGMMINSDQEVETYKWLGMSPQMRQWVGSRIIKQLREQGMTITNLPFETTLSFNVNELRRDKTGQIMIRVDDAAQRTNAHWAQLLDALIRANGTCYDGSNFFAADHSEGSSGTQGNLFTASEVSALNVTTATAPTADEAVDIIMGLIPEYFKLVDDQGEPINEMARNFLIMTNVAMFGAFQQAVYEKRITTSTGSYDNPIVGNKRFTVDVVPNPRFDANSVTTDIYTFRTDARVKPFIMQSEQDPTAQGLDEDSEHAFMNDEILIGIKALRNVGYGLWQYAQKATLS